MMFRRKFFAMMPLALACAGLSSCGQRDWRASVIADAENQIRTEVNDPNAKFSGVQVTGDDSTGQTCGFVTAKVSTGGDESGRFIVYIDQTAGPFIENNMGPQSMTHEQFEFSWQADCIKEGYKE